MAGPNFDPPGAHIRAVGFTLWRRASTLETYRQARIGIRLDGISINVRMRLKMEVDQLESWSPPKGDPVRAMADDVTAMLIGSPLEKALRGVAFHYLVSPHDASDDFA